jgi:segregation and condensation protein B
LLETLALIAYRQPITRSEIEDIRGVTVSSNIIRTLQEREWVRVVGHRDVPGRPAMYATSRQFLDYFNLQGLDQLPPLSDIRDLDEIGREIEKNMQAEIQFEAATAADEASEVAEGFSEPAEGSAETDPDKTLH